jgi:hypothetical protein
MSEIFENIRSLIQNGDIFISAHGYDELAQGNILIKEILSGMDKAIVLDDYPYYTKGPCTLVLKYDLNNNPIHIVWGIPKGKTKPAVLVTGYRPDPNLWSDDFRRRKK